MKEVCWKWYLHKLFSQKHANLTITPTVISSIIMYPHERDYVKSLFEHSGQALTPKCLKNDKNQHDLDYALEYSYSAKMK